jgi:hypothetical protein
MDSFGAEPRTLSRALVYLDTPSIWVGKKWFSFPFLGTLSVAPSGGAHAAVAMANWRLAKMGGVDAGHSVLRRGHVTRAQTGGKPCYPQPQVRCPLPDRFELDHGKFPNWGNR